MRVRLWPVTLCLGLAACPAPENPDGHDPDGTTDPTVFDPPAFRSRPS